jgi:hypothetical protein
VLNFTPRPLYPRGIGIGGGRSVEKSLTHTGIGTPDHQVYNVVAVKRVKSVLTVCVMFEPQTDISVPAPKADVFGTDTDE